MSTSGQFHKTFFGIIYTPSSITTVNTQGDTLVVALITPKKSFVKLATASKVSMLGRHGIGHNDTQYNGTCHNEF